MPLQGETLPDFASRPSGKTRPVRATFGPRSIPRAQLVVWAKPAQRQHGQKAGISGPRTDSHS